MSATIHYRKAGKEDPHLRQVWAPSSFIESMRRAFGTFPCVLTSEDVAKLAGMSAMLEGEHDPYGELIELIENQGSIEIYATY